MSSDDICEQIVKLYPTCSDYKNATNVAAREMLKGNIPVMLLGPSRKGAFYGFTMFLFFFSFSPRKSALGS